MYNLLLIGERIKSTRKERDMTLDDVAKAVGVARSTIQRYEAGLIATPKIPVLVAVAKALGVNEHWLMGVSEEKHTPQDLKPSNDDRVPVPLLGEVSAGLGSYAEDNIVGYIFEDRAGVGNDEDYVYL